jgi:hypothetical protein
VGSGSGREYIMQRKLLRFQFCWLNEQVKVADL